MVQDITFIYDQYYSFKDTNNTKVNSKIITISVRPEPRTETFEEPARILSGTQRNWYLKLLLFCH